VCREEFARFERVDEDRIHLLGDRALFESVVEAAGGSLRPSDVDLMIERARIQFAARSEEEFTGARAADLRTSDGLSLDDGTPMGDARSIDVEDYPLLLRLAQLKTGRAVTAHGRLATYHHLMLDEAQELSTIELSVLGHAIAKGGSVTVAGDPVQQIDESIGFLGWDAVIEALGVEQAAPVVLETSYRCTAPIAEFGQRVLGPLAPETPPVATKPGAPVSVSRVRNEMHAVALLAEALQALQAREPHAQVALLARAPERAESLYHALPEGLAMRLVLAGDFTFEPGIDVTTVQQVKGLEFDYVIVVDASAQTYPDDSLSRRTLHVAATRAIHQLWVIAVGSPSPLLPALATP
jgi:DNA helicase IV